MKIKPNRKQTTKERVAEMILLKQKGNSLQTIGNKFGITRERVRQLISKEPGYKSYKAQIFRQPDVSVKCICGEIFTKRPYHSKKYCSIKCAIHAMGKNYTKNLSREELLDYRNRRQINYYHTVLKHRPDFKEIVRKNNAKAELKKKLNK